MPTVEHIINLDREELDPCLLWGVNHTKLKDLRTQFPDLDITVRGEQVALRGYKHDIKTFLAAFGELLQQARPDLTPFGSQEPGCTLGDKVVYYATKKIIRARTPNQVKLVKSVATNAITFAIGPAGCGKTYLAVAFALKALKNKEIRKIILTRPAVEAGENIGFLPGDMRDKIDPYLKPLYDALEDMLPPHTLARYIETNVIEIAPIAFMRGRTLNEAFVILDEAQNATGTQIKMFLTRLGNASKIIITGDLSQIDLKQKNTSGLAQAVKLLRAIRGIGAVELAFEDNMRHPLVQAISEAYERARI